MMERINLENYEAFFLDYAEGNLTEQQLIELTEFLEKNPLLKKELEDFELIVLEEEPAESFELKNDLIKEETTGLSRTDYLMIAQVEGEITTEEKEELALLVKGNSALLEDLAVYHKTKLKEEKALVFLGKSALVQSEKKVLVWWHYASAVAAAILFVLLFNISFTEDVYQPREFSWKESPVEVDNISLELISTEEFETDSGKTINPPELLLPEENAVADNVQPQHKPTSIPVKKEVEDENLLAQEKETPMPISPEKEEDKVESISPDQSPIEDNDALAVNEKPKTNSEKQENFSPIKEVAINKIKQEVLKGKTFSETVMDELAEITNDKINFETKKDEKGATEKFAINIGKFSFSRNK